MPKEQIDDNDEDYRPVEDSEDEDSGSEGDFVSDLKELLPDEFEVVGLDGKISIVKGPELNEVEQKQKENNIFHLAQQDPRFEHFTDKRKLRFASIIAVGKESALLRDQEEIDCSDTAKELNKVAKGNYRMVECKAGNFINVDEGGVSLKRKLRQLTEAEMAEMTADDSTPCQCEVCARRRKNAITLEPKASGSRSGKKRGWDKWGPGRTLS